MRTTSLALLVASLAACSTEAPSPEPHAARRPLCQTPAHLRDIVRAPRPTRRADGKADGERTVRDPMGSFPRTWKSEHFAFKTGSSVAIDDAVAARVLVGLERAWQGEIVDRKLPVPLGTDQYFMNVYVGNSGDGAPEIPFEGAYVTADDEGYPYIAIHARLLTAGPEAIYTDTTLAHELFHTVQMTLGAYAAYERDGWYWEATAEWMADEIYPELPSYAVGGYLLLPHVSLDYIDYPDEGTLIEGHHYGAAIFPRFLSEQVADSQLVLDSWTQAQPEQTVVQAIGGLLAARGRNFDDVFADFAAHNAVTDYVKGAEYRETAELYAQQFPEEDARVILDLPATGTDWVDAPVATLPWGLGYNVIRLKFPAKGSLEVGVEGRGVGDAGSAAAFRATVVRQLPEGNEYVSLPFAGLNGTLRLDDVGREGSVYLVVSAQPASYEIGESFSYRVRLAPAAAPTPTPTPNTPAPAAEERGCALAGRTVAGGSLAPLVLLAALVLRARRRRFTRVA